MAKTRSISSKTSAAKTKRKTQVKGGVSKGGGQGHAKGQGQGHHPPKNHPPKIFNAKKNSMTKASDKKKEKGKEKEKDNASGKSAKNTKSKASSGKTKASQPGITDGDMDFLSERGYKLGPKLAEGGFSKVYISTFKDKYNKDKEVKLACKIVDTKKASKEFLQYYFPREIECMMKVNHKNIIRLHSLLQRKNLFFIFMQFAPNGDLLEFVKTHGLLKEKQSKKWFEQIVKAVAYMHEINICHRDLKCENVLLDERYDVKVTDFGFARFWRKGNPLSMSYCGSVPYCPPEILVQVPYDPKKSDIWSVGVILFVMSTKSMPFDDTSVSKMFNQQMNRGYKVPENVLPRMSQELQELVYLMLEPDPNKRMTPFIILIHRWIMPQDKELLKSEKKSFWDKFKKKGKEDAPKKGKDGGKVQPDETHIRIKGNKTLAKSPDKPGVKPKTGAKSKGKDAKSTKSTGTIKTMNKSLKSVNKMAKGKSAGKIPPKKAKSKAKTKK